MIEAVKYGIGLGLLLSVLIGPVFFILINVSIKEGFRSAMYLDIGIILSDAVCILLSYLGLAALLDDRENKITFIIVGSVVLIVMGMLRIFPSKKHKPKERKPIVVEKSNPFSLVVQGFFYNLLNPSVLLFWISTVGAAMALYDGNGKLVWTQFTTTLVVVLIIDTLKAWFAKKMRSFLTEDKIVFANKIIGVAFVIFAVVLLVRLFMGKI